jgi:hypothetical protein
MTLVLQVLSAAFAFGAAIFWFLASVEKGPANILEGIERLGGADFFGSHQVQIVQAIIKQSRLNAMAAMCAAISAILQGILILLSAFSP